MHLRWRWRHRPIRHIFGRELRNHSGIVAEILDVGTSEVRVHFFATGRRRGRGGGTFTSLLLPIFLTVFRRNLPLHAFARLICSAGNFLKGFVEGEIVPYGILQDCQHNLVAVEG